MEFVYENFWRILLTAAVLGLGAIGWRILFRQEEDHEEEHDE